MPIGRVALWQLTALPRLIFEGDYEMYDCLPPPDCYSTLLALTNLRCLGLGDLAPRCAQYSMLAVLPQLEGLTLLGVARADGFVFFP